MRGKPIQDLATKAKNHTFDAENGSELFREHAYHISVDLTNSAIASNGLLLQVEYPDNGVVAYAYNRQGQRIEMTDQNETVHEYAYDKLGRQRIDKVTDFGDDVDEAVKRIEWSFDNRKRLHHVKSFDAATSGDITSDVEYLYNDFSQMIVERQQHGAAADGSSPKVEYAYADGTSNTIRRTGTTYPDGRVVGYDYGTPGGANDKLSRVQRLKFDSTDIVKYVYLGLSQVVVQKYVEPSSDVVYTLDHGTANAYAGLDRFGRIIDLLWET